MAAELKIFSDSECTTELTGSPYALQIGPTTGLDGTNGEIVKTSVWVKNTGDVDIANVVLTETSDTDSRGAFSLDDNTYNNTTVTLGNMAVSSAAIRVYIRVTVASSTAVHVDEPLNVSISGTHL